MIYGNEIALRRRFVKDYNLPINIVDSPYFEYYMSTYDWFPKKEYENLVKDIDERFDGNINAWLEEYAQIRDKIITFVENSNSYKKFNSCDMNQFAIPNELKNIPDLNIYNQSSVGKKFLSIDLKKANFQALSHFDSNIVLKAESYEDFIGMWCDSEYFKNSKYTRQVIFGKLNPKRTITYEKWLMSQIKEKFESEFGTRNLKLIAFKSDEIIYEILGDNDVETWEHDVEVIMLDSGYDVRVEIFTVGRMECKNHNDVTVDCYIRQCHTTGKETLKSASQIFYPQFYKFWKNIRANCYDYAFLAEGQIAHFEFPLELVAIF